MWVRPCPSGCIPGLGRGRAVVLCLVGGLRGWGCCGVEAHGYRSHTVALGGKGHIKFLSHSLSLPSVVLIQ
jgi:hypothetical protein